MTRRPTRPTVRIRALGSKRVGDAHVNRAADDVSGADLTVQMHSGNAFPSAGDVLALVSVCPGTAPVENEVW